LTTPVNIALTGVVSGNVNFSGNTNVSITTSITGPVNPTANGVALGTATAAWALSATSGNFSGAMSVAGAATLQGGVTTSALAVTSNTIVLDSSLATAPSANATLVVNRGTSANSYLLWDETNKQWKLNAGSGENRIVQNDGTTWGISISGLAANATQAVNANTANNSSYLGGQLPTYYLAAGNLTGTVPAALLSGSYAISITGAANSATYFGGQLPAYYANASNLTTGQVSNTLLSGTYGISVTGSANSATYLNGQTGSFYQNASNLNTGTVATGLLSGTYGISITGGASTANNSTYFGGQLPAYYQNASNLNTGTVASGLLSGTYNITALQANNAAYLSGQNGAFYQNASNINTGTIGAGYLPATMNGTTFNSSIAVQGQLNAYTGAFTSGNVQSTVAAGSNGSWAAFILAGGAAANSRSWAISSDNSGNFQLNAYADNFSTIQQNAFTVTRAGVVTFAGVPTVSGSAVWYAGNFNPANYLGVNATANNSTNLGGNAPSYYLNASYINAGTLGTGYLSGTYNISISGTAANANELGGVAAGSFVQSGSNPGFGTVYFTNGSISGGGAWLANGAGFYTDGNGDANVRTYNGSYYYFGFGNNGQFTSPGDVVGFSDERLKDNIVPIANAKQLVRDLKGRRFTWKKDGVESIGFIAQEVQKVVPEMVHETNQDDILGVAYDKAVPILVEALKETMAEVEMLKFQVQQLLQAQR
jgi:hypothetical protein